MQKKVFFNYKNRKVKIDAKPCSFFSLGLILKTRNTIPCIFEFEKPTNFKISSLFVFFPFIAVWLDGKNKVIDIQKIEPFTISARSKKPFTRLIEIPINKKYNKLAKSLISRR